MPRKLSHAVRKLFLPGVVLAVVIAVVNAWNVKPQVWLIYQFQAPGAIPVRVDRCGDDDPREYFYREGPDGTSFNVELCFKAVQKERLKFIPYADEDRSSWIELKNSPQVGAYTRTVARSFTLPQSDHGEVIALWQKELWQARIESLQQLAAAVFSFGLLCWLIAWMARRLFGHPAARHSSQRT